MSNVQDEIDTSEPAVSVPDTGDSGESGKLKMIVSLIKKCFGVKDIASMCVLSLLYTAASVSPTPWVDEMRCEPDCERADMAPRRVQAYERGRVLHAVPPPNHRLYPLLTT